MHSGTNNPTKLNPPWQTSAEYRMSRHVAWTMGFGGPWTTEPPNDPVEWLSILESYLNSYTTALKSRIRRRPGGSWQAARW